MLVEYYMKLINLIVHSIRMVRRNLKSYAMLSITIILSFSLLLGYLLFMDTSSYNQYKEIFSSPREIVLAYTYTNRSDVLQSMISLVQERFPSSHAYVFNQISTNLPQYDHVAAHISLLPANETLVFREVVEEKSGIKYSRQVNVIEGKSFPLQIGEAIINESAYHSLWGHADLPVSLQIPIHLDNGSTSFLSLSVVGICEDVSAASDAPLYYKDDGQLCGTICLYASQTNMNGDQLRRLGECKKTAIIYTKRPDDVVQICEQYELLLDNTVVIHAVNSAQQSANEQLRSQSTAKAIMVIILFLILGINLFGSFSNALSTRRYEIGVKQAIGASTSSIVLQFLVEGFIVTFCNILISIALISNLSSIAKLYFLIAHDTEIIIHLNKYSLAYFAVSSASISIVFSVIFAFMATRNEIVKHLKSE